MYTDIYFDVLFLIFVIFISISFWFFKTMGDAILLELWTFIYRSQYALH